MRASAGYREGRQEHGPGSRRRGDVAIAPRHSARSARERTQRSPARALTPEPCPAGMRRAPAARRPAVAHARPAPGRTTATALADREPPPRLPEQREPRRRTGFVLVLAFGILLAMGAVLAVFAGGESGTAPAVAAPAPAAPRASAAAPVVEPEAPEGPVALTPSELARCPATSVACVDLAGHTAWLQRDGRPLTGPLEMLPGADTFHRPPGPDSSATPAGTFHVLRKERNGFRAEFHEPMNHAVYFAPGGIAFHEGSLTTTSNGCIHLSAADAATFFDTLRTGDGVTTF